MYIIHNRNLKRPADLIQVPQGEVFTFLKEWFDEKPYVIGHTSGSTGTPKEIRLDKEDMRASAVLTNSFFGISAESVLLLCLSVSYIAGKMMVVRALEAGADLCVVPVGSHPMQESVDGGLSDMKIDLAAMVPMQVEESLRVPSEKAAFGSIRQLLIGGAPVSPELEKRLQHIPTQCYATYGMTETVSHIALRKLNDDGNYIALGNVTFSTDERGCLVIDAPHLRSRHFVTNDLVELSDEHRFRWLGRFDNVINSGGLKFFPEVIESKISSLFSCRFFITSQPDERLGQRIILMLEGANRPDVNELLQNMRKLLSAYEMPRAIFTCCRFRETTSGKIMRDLGWILPTCLYDDGKRQIS